MRSTIEVQRSASWSDHARLELVRASAGQLAAWVAAGEVGAEEAVRAHLAVVAERNPGLNALVLVDAEGALEQARRVDRMRSRGDALGPLAGVPVVVKDNIDVRRQTTSSGSRAHAGSVALRDATVVSRLRTAGALILGRANMDELAMGASTQTSSFGPTRNPWDLRRSPGGSSGGSAAAVAAGLAPLSVGTDTGGSVREPAAQCGVVGMAPSPGLVPMRGVVPFAAGFDRVGPLARTVGDARLLLATLAGRTPADAEALPARVGVVRELAGRGNQGAVLHRLTVVAAVLESLGVEVVDVSVPDAARGLAAYMALTSAACVPVFEPYVRTGLAGPEVVRRYELGCQLITDDAALREARHVRASLTEQVLLALTECGALLSPTMPTTAPVLFGSHDGSPTSVSDMADPMHAPYTDCWSVVANLAGVPAVSVPAGRSAADGMPVGVQLSGPVGSDGLLLQLAAGVETAGIDAEATSPLPTPAAQPC